MNFNEYQEKMKQTKIYKEKFDRVYPALGLGGEVGEVLEIVKKIYRDADGVPSGKVLDKLELEMGDVLWYLSALATDFGISLQEIAERNVEKLFKRKELDKLHGSGSDR